MNNCLLDNHHWIKTVEGVGDIIRVILRCYHCCEIRALDVDASEFATLQLGINTNQQLPVAS